LLFASKKISLDHSLCYIGNIAFVSAAELVVSVIAPVAAVDYSSIPDNRVAH
jgi:hypothetical protein